jgi:hypothetical protein
MFVGKLMHSCYLARAPVTVGYKKIPARRIFD